MLVVIRHAVTLNELAAAHPLYPQTWYYEEPFASVPLLPGEYEVPVELDPWTRGEVPADTHTEPSAVLLAAAWVQADGGLWHDDYVWTCDTDSEGQRVYVGRSRPQGLQIHRHLEITSRWGRLQRAAA